MSVDMVVAPIEPVLDADEIQGNALPGFMKPNMILAALAIGDQTDDARRAREWLSTIAPRIATLARVMASRKVVRAARTLRPSGSRLGKDPIDDLWLNIAFSFQGLTKLARGRAKVEAALADFEDQGFRRGLAARSSLLGDPTEAAAEGNSQQWVFGGPGHEADILLIVAADRLERATGMMDRLRAEASARGLRVLHEQQGAKFDKAGAEHFGFQDGVSQPGVRGRLSDSPDDVLGHRAIDPAALPDSLLYDLPGQLLIWPGEFVFGYPGASADPLVPGPVKLPGPSWSRNGSYVVYRRLRQDVEGFWRFVDEAALALRQRDGFAGWTKERLAAALVGRWRSGAPLVRAPEADDEDLGHDRLANNIFGYATTAGTLTLRDGTTTNHRWPNAAADPIGLVCPLGAHIRKVNARESADDLGGARASLERRILRRGLPYGPPLEDPFGPDATAGDRGLMFVSYQTSIVDQFEFLATNWMNSAVNPRSPGGFDMLVGQNGHPGQGRRRHLVLFGKDLTTAEVSTDREFVVPTGGGYFFSPSITALQDVLANG